MTRRKFIPEVCQSQTFCIASSAADVAWNMSQEAGILSVTTTDENRVDNIIPFPQDFNRRQFCRLTRIIGLSGC
jgi:hypothetical protein